MVSRVENQLLLHQVIQDLKRGLTGHFQEKKMQWKCNETKKFLILLLKKNKQANKQTNKKAKTRQNKSLVSISNVGDQLWFGFVLTYRSSLLTLWSSAVSSTTCICGFHQIRKGKWLLQYVCVILYIGSFYLAK